MKHDTRVSVCIATYNGARYIREQMDSILAQLHQDDEVIVSDDHSTDETCAIIGQYADARIKLVKNPGRAGHVRNFAHAMSHASGEYIALSDQDDIWVEQRLDKMLAILRTLPRYSLVVGEFAEFDANGQREITMPLGKSPSGMLGQLIRLYLGKAKYFGCAFMFRRDLMRFVMPIPGDIEAHDIWIAMNACMHGKVAHCEQPTLLRRLHGSNLTPSRRRSLPKIARSRLIYTCRLFQSLFK